MVTPAASWGFGTPRQPHFPLFVLVLEGAFKGLLRCGSVRLISGRFRLGGVMRCQVDYTRCSS